MLRSFVLSVWKDAAQRIRSRTWQKPEPGQQVVSTKVDCRGCFPVVFFTDRAFNVRYAGFAPTTSALWVGTFEGPNFLDLDSCSSSSFSVPSSTAYTNGTAYFISCAISSRRFFRIVFFFFFSGLCWGKAMVAYTKPQHRRKEESGRLRG